MYNDDYIRNSLELHLFFGRIMKEHSFFLKAGFTPANQSFSNKAEYFKSEFENLLSQAVTLSNGNISSEVLNSGELVTEFTSLAERQSEAFTGIAINKGITQREMRLQSGRLFGFRNNLSNRVGQLNQRALRLLDGLISFKESILRNVLNCNMFTMNYPLLIEHIIREAKLYRQYIELLERNGNLSNESMRDIECFCNRIMMEHAMFIRGLLDPSEAELINVADGFAKDYAQLLEKCHKAHEQTISSDSLEQTVKFRDFKTAGVKGIENCDIRSIILPLLADHVLREANHYIRLLK
ncbi:MAG: DUF2935 domain-containing protein [Clostridia bacterium]|nr:DUF2935 domain-containing protein [Clostridia bacterium]